jgi:hypothetical protein
MDNVHTKYHNNILHSCFMDVLICYKPAEANVYLILIQTVN